MKKQISFLLLGLVVLLSSCKTYSDNDKNGFDAKMNAFAKKSGLPFEKSESGLYYYIESEGEGEYIKFTDEVSFTYTGRFLDGTLFDGQHKTSPLTFEVSKLIEGWKEGFAYVKKGGKIKLIIPPYLGYGDHDLNDIPPHSILYFDIQIVDVR